MSCQNSKRSSAGADLYRRVKSRTSGWCVDFGVLHDCEKDGLGTFGVDVADKEVGVVLVGNGLCMACDTVEDACDTLCINIDRFKH